MIYTLFWKKKATPNIVEEVHHAFVKGDRDSEMRWINTTNWPAAITMYRDIWQQRIEKIGYGASIEDLHIVKNVPGFWEDSPRPKGLYSRRRDS